jgi:hypothetical protein
MTEIRFKDASSDHIPQKDQVVMSLTPNKAPASFVTPTKRAALVSGTDAGPSRARPQGASPAYVRLFEIKYPSTDSVEFKETLFIRCRRSSRDRVRLRTS